MKITDDPTCIIVYQKEDTVIYYNWDMDQSWIIFGKCNLCGACLESVIAPTYYYYPYVLRRDIPVRPEISKLKECSLRGEYL